MDKPDSGPHAPIPFGISTFVPTVLEKPSTSAEKDQEKYTMIKKLCEDLLDVYDDENDTWVCCIHFTPEPHKTNLMLYLHVGYDSTWSER